jgi:hypothetical protein
MELVPGFVVLLQALSPTMTAPSFESFTTIACGWMLASRRTVTRMLLSVGESAEKHFSSYHRLFSSARWSLDQLGLAVFTLVEPWIEGNILLALDDTLARKRGRKMFGVGMHHDPLLSSRGHAVVNSGHSWVVLGVVAELPFRPGHYFCLPILFRLYLNKANAQRHRRVYRTRPELAVSMLRTLCESRKTSRFHVVADSAYGGQSVLGHLPANCDLTSRLLLDARLYDAPLPRRPGQRGRPRRRGEQLPSPRKMLAGRCRRVQFDVYGKGQRARLADCQARVYAVPERLLRVVAIEPLVGGRPPQAFYTTCADASAEDVITSYARRWTIEVAFHDSKQHLGFEQPQGWSRRAVERTAPLAMIFYTLVVLWFAGEGHRQYRPLDCPWYTSKAAPSFADMLATLRRLSVRERINKLGLQGPGSRKIQQLLENTLAIAA